MSRIPFDTKSTLPRICMISTHGYVAADPPLGAADTGGQVVFVLELSKKLAQLGYEVDIWTRKFEDQPDFDVINSHVRVLRMPCGGRDFIPKEYLYKKLPEWGENALRFIKRHQLKYEFINSHYWDAGLAGQHLSEVLGVPHVHTPHSLGIWKQRQMETDYPDKKEKFEKEFNFERRIHHEKILYRECDQLVATTPVQTDMFIEDYEIPRENVVMIPPGYDDNRFYPVGAASREALRKKFKLRGRPILALGRLATNKGYDLLIDAFSVVAERNQEARLYLMVGGKQLDKQERGILNDLKARVREYGLEKRVKFGSFISDEDLPDYYRAADVFVLSSRYEPFGMTAIEAMASGTPSVVTTHGGLYRAVSFGRDALYADTFDKEDLGIMMVKLLKHPVLWNRISRHGAHKARSLFTWTGIAQQLISAVERRTSEPFRMKDDGPDDAWSHWD